MLVVNIMEVYLKPLRLLPSSLRRLTMDNKGDRWFDDNDGADECRHADEAYVDDDANDYGRIDDNGGVSQTLI